MKELPKQPERSHGESTRSSNLHVDFSDPAHSHLIISGRDTAISATASGAFNASFALTKDGNVIAGSSATGEPTLKSTDRSQFGNAVLNAQARDASNAIRSEAVKTGNALLKAQPDFNTFGFSGKINPSALKVLSEGIDRNADHLSQYNETLNRELDGRFKLNLTKETRGDLLDHDETIKTITVTDSKDRDKEVFRAEEIRP